MLCNTQLDVSLDVGHDPCAHMASSEKVELASRFQLRPVQNFQLYMLSFELKFETKLWLLIRMRELVKSLELDR